MQTDAPDRNLALDLVRVTEAGALAAARWMGLDDPVAGDQAAIDAMAVMLATVDMAGTVVPDATHYASGARPAGGTRVGTGTPPAVDVAVDPVDGTRSVACGRSNTISAVAVSEAGSLFDPAPVRYMEKIAVGPSAAAAIDLSVSVEQNLRAIARATRKDVDDLSVAVLDRPRHVELIHQIRAAGARIRLLTDGDLAGAIMAATEGTGVDVLLGIGGAAEGIVAACALSCVGGAFQARLVPASDAERAAAVAAGRDPARILTTHDLVASENVFFAATGITDGELLRGVQFHGGGARTTSMTMRSRSGTVRIVEARHRWDKLMHISQVAYDTRPA